MPPAEVLISDLVRAAEMAVDRSLLGEALRVLQGGRNPAALMTKEEVCKTYGVSPKSVQRHCRVAQVVGGRNMYRHEMVVEDLVRSPIGEAGRRG